MRHTYSGRSLELDLCGSSDTRWESPRSGFSMTRLLGLGLDKWDSSAHSGRSSYEGIVTGVALTPDGSRAVSASYDKSLKVWDLGTVRNSLPAGWISEFKVSQCRRMGAELSRLRGIRHSRSGTWRSVSTLSVLAGHSNMVYAVTVTSNGAAGLFRKTLADQTLKIWNLASGKELHTPTGHSSGINSITVTVDGRRAVSASDDGTLKVWDLSSGAELRTLAGHTDGVNGVALTSDGEGLFPLRAIKRFPGIRRVGRNEYSGGHSEVVHGVAVTPDGRRAVSASYDLTLSSGTWRAARSCVR